MVFSGVVFLLYFLPISLGLYFLTPKKYRNYTLFVLSVIFYAWGEPRYVLLLLVSIIINYYIGVGIGKVDNHKKAILVIGIILDLGCLFFFKYIDFFISILSDGLLKASITTQIEPLGIVLPIGISFFTFQEISYIVDVYRGVVPAQRNIMKLGLYISMFPQLIAGPIVRYTDVVSEIDERHSTWDDVYVGLRRFVIGLSEKVMIADILANVANKTLTSANSEGVSVGIAWLGAIAYTLQIYFDFAGYSNMAIGLARVFGFHLSENFNVPYVSKSISEFWRRWHISLGSWFRDYVYIPMGGNRKGNVYLHLIIVFALTGLWHGAAWNFVVWGLWHGVFIVIERFLKNRISIKIPTFFMWVYTMLVVILGWVLFEAGSLTEGWNYICMMFGQFELPNFIPYNIFYYIDGQIIATLIVAIIISMGVHLRILKKIGYCEHSNMKTDGKMKLFKLILDVAVIVLLVFDVAMVVNGNYSPFIYFRF